LRLHEYAHGKYDPRKHRNDGVDVMHLMVLGFPAILCTRDTVLQNLARATKSSQAERVVVATELRSLLTRLRHPMATSDIGAG
jgi:hypothetical protein